jgi:hypothetical protein
MLGMLEEKTVPRDAPTPALPQRGREKFGVRALLPRPFGERAGERGTREAMMVPRGAPTLAPPEGEGEIRGPGFVPSPLWGEGWGEGHA